MQDPRMIAQAQAQAQAQHQARMAQGQPGYAMDPSQMYYQGAQR